MKKIFLLILISCFGQLIQAQQNFEENRNRHLPPAMMDHSELRVLSRYNEQNSKETKYAYSNGEYIAFPSEVRDEGNLSGKSAEYPVTITVYDINGQPLKNAGILIYKQYNIVTAVETNESGVCIIPLVSGEYVCFVEKWGNITYGRQEKNITVGEAACEVSISYAEGYYPANFQLTDPSGAGMPYSRVAISSPALRIPTPYTDISGNCTVYLPNGIYTYTAIPEDYSVQSGELIINNSGKDIAVAYTSEYLIVTFKVVGVAGQALEWSSIEITSQADHIFSGYTDYKGELTAYLLRGQYDYFIKNEMYDHVHSTQKGTVVVSDNGQIVDISYTTGYFPVQVSTTGLASDEHSVIKVINELTMVEALIYGDNIQTIYLPNGDYNYIISNSNYPEKKGAVTVNNAPQSITETYSGSLVTFLSTDTDGVNLMPSISIFDTRGLKLAHLSRDKNTIRLPDGVYSYTILHISSYSTIKASFTVNSEDQTISYSYTSNHYPVTVNISYPVQENIHTSVMFFDDKDQAVTNLYIEDGEAETYLPSGNFTYEIYASGYAVQKGQLIIDNATAVLDISYTTGYHPITFQITNASDFNGMPLHISDGSNNYFIGNSRFTGNFCTVYLPDGAYRYFIGGAELGSTEGTLSVKGAAQTIPVTHEELHEITFHITDTSGTPIEGMEVRLDKSGTNEFTEKNGKCTFKLIDGEYTYFTGGKYAAKEGTVIVKDETQTVSVVISDDYHPVSFYYKPHYEIYFELLEIEVYDVRDNLVARYYVRPNEHKMVLFPNGDYSYKVNYINYSEGSGITTTRKGAFTVNGTEQTIILSYADYRPVTFRLDGPESLDRVVVSIYNNQDQDQSLAEFSLYIDGYNTALLPDGDYNYKAIGTHPEKRENINVAGIPQMVTIAYSDHYYPVTFKVVDKYGIPAKSATVLVKNSQLQSIISERTPTNGEITLYLPNGTYTHEIWHRDGSLQKEFTVQDEALSLLVTLAMETAAKPDNTLTVSAYPNPVLHTLHINCKSDDTYVVSIYGMAGKICLHKTFTGTTDELDMSHYPTGVYLLVIENKDKQRTVLKIVKTN